MLSVSMLLLASVLVTSDTRSRRDAPAGLRPSLRASFALIAIAALVTIAIPLSTSTMLRQSQADAKAGDLAAALSAARTAQNAQPSAATPRLQKALLLEAGGELRPAVSAARAATERESTNWGSPDVSVGHVSS